MLRVLLAAAVGAVASSLVAAPWTLPQPLDRSVRRVVDSVSEAWLWWGYGLRERPYDEPRDQGPARLLVPIAETVKGAAKATWRTTWEVAVWLARHAPEMVAVLRPQSGELRAGIPPPSGARQTTELTSYQRWPAQTV